MLHPLVWIGLAPGPGIKGVDRITPESLGCIAEPFLKIITKEVSYDFFPFYPVVLQVGGRPQFWILKARKLLEIAEEQFVGTLSRQHHLGAKLLQATIVSIHRELLHLPM